jgi:hypothetical protein
LVINFMVACVCLPNMLQAPRLEKVFLFHRGALERNSIGTNRGRIQIAGLGSAIPSGNMPPAQAIGRPARCPRVSPHRRLVPISANDRDANLINAARRDRRR